MPSLATPFQMGGALPVVGVLLALLLAAIVVYALRNTGEYHDPGAGDAVVCPRCHHSTAASDSVCPECGKDL
ncbi:MULTISPECIES: hypothetical protein [Haloarcula]|uniref:Uncharacterized protein n=1 Tax=Haloarcula pellucida TaxID=1427151 RepID=A0A830GL94_9EURY|nr:MULTISPECIES: hypothetical protein [Halomicroarcula]MBX0347704.1 hypothetical protein [Halomicroarcula pellucida]MDS0276363.1 hypothetical protein [Halomicroarcula sp. S1AR25-4]GGN89936.1 hypothetical protein GCM10009030_11280 [Halomicroarcula pellucida]